jgi:hypothetical protein
MKLIQIVIEPLSVAASPGERTAMDLRTLANASGMPKYCSARPGIDCSTQAFISNARKFHAWAHRRQPLAPRHTHVISSIMLTLGL